MRHLFSENALREELKHVLNFTFIEAPYDGKLQFMTQLVGHFWICIELSDSGESYRGSIVVNEDGDGKPDAEDMIEAYFKIYKGMKKWRDKTVSDTLNNGYITLLSGRKRRFTQAVNWINSKYAEDCWQAGKLKQDISRQAMNFPVQGGAHEVFEPAVTRVVRRLKKEGLKARILLSIHDGIVGECPREELETVSKILSEEMPVTFNKGTKYELKLDIDKDFYKSNWYGEKIKL